MAKETLPPGVHVALVTPMTPDADVDVEGARRLVEYVLAGGVHGLNIMGSTGEVASLSEPKRRKVVDTVIQAANGRVPAIAAVCQNTVEDAIKEIKALQSQGLKGALLLVPSYYPLPPAGIESFYRSVADKVTLPILIYNIPPFTKVVVPPDVVASLAKDGVVAGIKDSSRDFEYFSQVRFKTLGIEGFKMFIGSDTQLLGSMMIGGDGTIAGAPNVGPKLDVGLYNAVRAQEWEKAAKLQKQVFELVMAVRCGAFPAGIKAGMELLGICSGRPVPPIPAVSPAEKEKLAVALKALGILS